MKTNKIKTFLKENISVPLALLKNYKEFKITSEELVLVLYLISLDEEIYDPLKISKDLNEELEKIMVLIDSLENKNILVIDAVKNEKGVLSEYVSLDPLYLKLTNLAISEINEEESNNSLYEVFEKEFGRTLSPIEFEIINGWIENEYKEDLILYALKEAIFNGANSFRYIDKILYTWDKKGLNTIEKIEKEKSKFNKKDEEIEGFDYNWLEED